MSEEFGGVLDLSGADTRGFPVPETGTYDCELHDFKWDKTKGGATAKLPEGSPLLKIQFKIIEPEYENTRCFTQFAFPPADYDEEKRNKMLGMFVRFMVSLGYEEADIKQKKFDINKALDAKIGEPIRVTGEKVQKYGTKPEDNEWQFNVKGPKPAGEPITSDRVL